MLLAGTLEKQFGLKVTLSIGGSLFVSGVILSSFATSFIALLFTYGVLFGSGIGICYSPPIVNCIRFLPHRRGMVTGTIVAGFGSGSAIFGLLATALLNPLSLSVDATSGYFPTDSPVVSNVPSVFLVLGASYGCLILIAIVFLIVEHPECNTVRSTNTGNESNESTLLKQRAYEPVTTQEDKTNELRIPMELDTYQLMRTSLGWHLGTCFVMTAVGGMFFAGSNKVYASEYFTNQSFLSTVIAASSMFNGLGRIVCGVIADSVGPLLTITYVSFIFSFILLTYSLSAQSESEAIFTMSTFALMFCEGSNFALYLPITMQVWGEKHASSNYGFIFSSYSFINVINICFLASIGVDFSSASLFLGFLCFLGTCNLLWFGHRIKPVASV